MITAFSFIHTKVTYIHEHRQYFKEVFVPPSQNVRLDFA
jgi:hypothetical protein